MISPARRLSFLILAALLALFLATIAAAVMLEAEFQTRFPLSLLYS